MDTVQSVFEREEKNSVSVSISLNFNWRRLQPDRERSPTVSRFQMTDTAEATEKQSSVLQGVLCASLKR